MYYRDHVLFIHSSFVNGHLCYFPLLAVVNNAAMNMVPLIFLRLRSFSAVRHDMFI